MSNPIILNLSNALAKKWKVKTKPLPQEDLHGLYKWRLDQITLGNRRSNLICMNEETYFAFVLRDIKPFNELNAMQAFIHELSRTLKSIGSTLPIIDEINNTTIHVGKNSDKGIIGFMNAIKSDFLFHVDYDDYHTALDLIQDGVYGYEDNKSPIQRFKDMVVPVE